MNSKTKIVIFIISIFLLSVISGCVKEGEKVGEMDVGDMFANFFEKLAKFFRKEIEWPTAFGKTQKMQLWIPLTLFFILFMAVFAAAKKHIKIFSDQKNMQVIFSLAFTFAALFGTPLLKWWVNLIALFGAATWIALFITGGYFMWALLSRGFAESSKISAGAGRLRAKAAEMNAESDAIRKKIKEGKIGKKTEEFDESESKKKKKKAASNITQKKQIQSEKKLIKKLTSLQNNFNKLIKNKNSQAKWQEVEEDIRDIVKELEKIKGLEKQEIALAQLGKLDKETKKLIGTETKFLKNFSALIDGIFKEVKGSTPLELKNAREYSKTAKEILKQLIKINKKQMK